MGRIQPGFRLGKGMASFDPEAVRAFEHAGWQAVAAEYNATFAHASGCFVDALLDAAGVGAATRLLDVCCGTGVVTGAAADRGAEITGLDFSAAMLDQARREHARLRFDEGDAEALPYADGSFEAVVSNFGIHHIAHSDRAMAEARRVLRPGGRLAITNWAAPAENIAWRLLFDAIDAHGDLQAANAPPSGGNLQTPEAALRLLAEAGFVECRSDIVRREWRIAEPRDLIAALARGTVRTAALINAQPAETRPRIEGAIEAAAVPYRRDGGYAVPIAAILASGTAPAG
jgi:ubiquinone/menaquinone biosynthesis C-methylase UbiE